MTPSRRRPPGSLTTEAWPRTLLLALLMEMTRARRIAALLGVEDGRKRERRLAAIQQQPAELELRWKPGDRQQL